ncbi:UNKNOWN [Stylonychia lemnae]|uniref:Uncharacterized protein n=1 Tax=Stylonychia lemnae TaxID=5949 RepID=A0A078A0A6_STYLE|nr:UNKNOWN [Stylonychia lemnae]|eukprot:CDW74863.1 UNKNOWN [Stylonychia lemnae]
MKAALVISFLFSSSFAWPGYKSTKLRDNDDCIDTAQVHNSCGEVRKPNGGRPHNVRYPSAFTMSFDKWDILCDFSDPNCAPPYYPSAPDQLKDKYPMVNGPGFTYYNSTFRGGAQVEKYTDRCVPIFPNYVVDFPCTFYLIKDEGKAYLTTKNAPAEFGDCCILANNFHPPVRNFSERTNFTGIKTYGPSQKYVGLEVNAPNSGGIFSYNFWADEQVEQRNNQTYHVPSFFYYTGLSKNENNPQEPLILRVYQSFYNFSTDSFRPEDHFTMPASCNPKAPLCPDFNQTSSTTEIQQ